MKPELVSSIFTLICFLPFTFAQEQDEENTIPSEITESFHPWSYAPICTEPLKALGGPLCVYTNATFANGRGISIFTTPKISESFAAEIPFHDDNVLAEHGINDPHGDEARPWYVADLAGKGKGVLAKHELRRGDRITAYTPYILVHMESEFTVDEREKWLKMAIRQLPEASQEHFFSLATIWNEKGYEVQDVIKANAFEMQVGGVMHVGVFPETSRLNHACSPNAQYFLEPGLLTHFVHASRDIAPDEEITVSYAPPLRFHETRQKYLKDHFHFTCDCPRCQNGLASDDALHQIDTLQSSLGNWTPESTASVKKAEELIRLYKQEGLEGFLDTAYGYAALTYNAVGSVRGAKRYAKLAAESAALKYGPSYKDIATWKDLENDPQGHYSHLVLPKQHAFRRAFGTFPDHARRYLISEGRTTSPPDEQPPPQPATSSSPFYLETGYSIFAKRPSRPFPPPFVSAPSGSFSDPLTTHNAPRGRRPYVNGQLVRGITNGDDAIIIGDANFIAVDDGVGAWALKERGHAALWSRLIAHFWAVEVEKSFTTKDGAPVKLDDLNPIQNLQDAYEQTKAATKGTLKDEPDPLSSSSSDSSSESSQKGTKDEKHEKDTDKDKDKDKEKPGENDILGTTTASSALLYHTSATPPVPVILATTLGDCKVLILRPSFARNSTQESKSSSSGNSNGGGGSGVAATKPKSTTTEEEVDFSKCILYRSTEQWHWFDCPRQLGTNSPDTPVGNGVCDTVEVSPGDVVAVLSDGVTDNLWEHEIAETICTCVQKWEAGVDEAKDGIVYVARTLMNAAREVAQDPNAESPYMERAFDEGIAAEGGKLDDISVVLGLCRKREDK